MGIPLIVNKFIDLFFRSKKCIKLGKDSPYWIYPIDLSHKSIVYSAGVGKDVSFELELYEKFKPKIFLFDPSPTGKETIDKLIKKPFKFYKKGIAGATQKCYFDVPKRINEGSYSISNKENRIVFDCISISDFMRDNKNSKIDLLKIDIEGFEYGVIDDIIDNNLSIPQICLEFHHFLKNGSYLKTLKYIIKLYNFNYRLIYKDVDNFTFVKKDFL